MLHSIAVTTDFSPASRKSISAAATLARKFGSRIQIVHVAEGLAAHQSPGHAAMEEAAGDGAKALERGLLDLVQSCPELEGLRAEPRILRGEPIRVLRRLQEGEGIDLMVVASHGSSSVRRFLLGSFATKLLQSVASPVLVFRRPEEREEAATLEAGQLAFLPHRILVAHDFSPTSSASLEVARSWARAFDASVRILFVAARLPASYERAPASPNQAAGNGRNASATGSRSIPERVEAARSEALARLRDIVTRDWEGIPAEPVTCTGNPAEQILREADELHANLIVLASHGMRPAEGRPLGSVTERVVHGARCPVLVVKRPGPGGEAARSRW